MTSLINKISASLKEDNSDANRRRWGSYIIKNKIAIMDLVKLIHYDYPVAIRFSWVLGGICELEAKHIYPSITYLFSKRDEIQIPNFNRSLCKMFYLAGVPPEIEGEAIDEMFKWLLDSKTNVTTKRFAILAIHKLSARYPDLKNELKVVIEEQLDKFSSSFEKRAREFLKIL